MNIISKKKQGVIAIICAIAMVVTSLTIYNPREVKADTEYKDLKYTQVGDKDYWVAAGNDDFPFQMVQDQNDQFLIIPQVAAGTKPIWPDFKDVTLNGEKFNQAAGAGIYIKYADLKENYYNIYEGTSAVDNHRFQIIIKAGNPSSGGEESSEVERPAAPQGLVFELNDSKTGYLIKFGPIPRATSYKFYVDGTFKKEVAASGETITIDELGIELGKTYKFGVSAVNSNGESTVSELEVQVPAIEYAITLDDKKITDISYGNTYKLSNNEQGYYDVDKKVAYAPETVITVKSDMNLMSIDLNVEMQNGASIRFKDPTGLRFQTKITSNNNLSLNEILNNGTVIKTGTIITTSTILGENGVVNDEFVKDNSKLKLDITNSGWYGNTVGTFCGSIVNIAESNYTTDFVGVGYVTIKYTNDNVKPKTIYASSNNIRSVATVAQNIINDTTTTERYEGKTYYEYLQGKGLSAIVDKYAGVANKDNK